MNSARRAHTKSKNGCDGCKQMKRKCDERIPCTNCTKRHRTCSLLASVPSSSASPPSPPASPPQPHETFSISDFALFHHFTTSTSSLIANEPPYSSPWKTGVPALATQYPFLLHEVLALAAVHLSQLNPSKSAYYLRVAGEHQAFALSLFRAALAAGIGDGDAAEPLFACSALFVSYYFAVAPDPAALLFSTDPPGPPEWMLPLRGCTELVRCYKRSITDGPMGNLMSDYIAVLRAPTSGGADAHIDGLRDGLAALSGDWSEGGVLLPVLDKLRTCFALSDSDSGDGVSNKTATFMFAATVPARFVDMLGEKSPGALVVMAFWCVLLHRINRRWMLYGADRASEMLDLIESLLSPRFREMIRWPLEVVKSTPQVRASNGQGDATSSAMDVT
ncbi:hypothetical protein NKR23_g5151 [Pleurostoma richardsiae]|uniref:Zn(2)-C6 fungal-type domain-containing protein n=1 Tax=Pleurostoma richardsiae TaxID=41990 RepID=A0AA38RPR7_9PEZI|nr:hypothetical protein NKR23_g5151 [Pleurostoma richardsiae]